MPGCRDGVVSCLIGISDDVQLVLTEVEGLAITRPGDDYMVVDDLAVRRLESEALRNHRASTSIEIQIVVRGRHKISAALARRVHPRAHPSVRL